MLSVGNIHKKSEYQHSPIQLKNNDNHTVKYHSNDPGPLRKHSGKSGGRSFNWYSYLEGRLADILPILWEGLLNGRGHLYGTLRYDS